MQDIELIAAKIHEGWIDTKLKQGITSRKSESGEELIVPYERLSESAKDLDRGSVRAVLEAQAKLASHPASSSLSGHSSGPQHEGERAMRTLIEDLPGVDIYQEDGATDVIDFEHAGQYVKRADVLAVLTPATAGQPEGPLDSFLPPRSTKEDHG